MNKLNIEKIKTWKLKETFMVVSSFRTFPNNGRFIGTLERHSFSNLLNFSDKFSGAESCSQLQRFVSFYLFLRIKRKKSSFNLRYIKNNLSFLRPNPLRTPRRT